jgi:hypothetical protein
VAGEAVDEVVLAAVGLVGDDDDVAPLRKHGVAVAHLGRHELPDGREDDSSAGDAELLAQVGPLGGLDGIPAQQVVTARELNFFLLDLILNFFFIFIVNEGVGIVVVLVLVLIIIKVSINIPVRRISSCADHQVARRYYRFYFGLHL